MQAFSKIHLANPAKFVNPYIIGIFENRRAEDTSVERGAMDIAKYLSKDCILFLKDTIDRPRVLEALIDAAYSSGKIKNKNRFAKILAARELIVSTGIGLGVAVPHAKYKSLDSFFVVLGILEQGVDWESIDGSLVRLVFLIGGPDDNPKEYLLILSQIVKLVKSSIKREKLLEAQNPEMVLSLLLS